MYSIEGYESHGNRVGKHKANPNPNPLDVRKVPANSVPYGDSISRNGKWVWVVMEEGRVVCVAATSSEVRSKYLELKRNRMRQIGAGENLEDGS